MFQINYRIIIDDSMDELKTADVSTLNREWTIIEGFIEMHYGEQREGYYHGDPLRVGEVGDEIINDWLEKFLDVVTCLEKGMAYAAFAEIEYADKWIEFKRWDQSVVINIVLETEEKPNARFLTEPLTILTYKEPRNVTVSYAQFKQGVISAVQSFLQELEAIKPNLLKTRMGIHMLQKLSEIC